MSIVYCTRLFSEFFLVVNVVPSPISLVSVSILGSVVFCSISVISSVVIIIVIIVSVGFGGGGG